MRGLRTGVVLMLALAATSAAAKHSRQAAFAEPGDIIAAEGNFNHLSAAKGMKAAIRATSVANAQIIAPQLMRAPQFADSAAAGQAAPQWRTRQMWMSCDGSIAVTHGEWQRTPATGSPAIGWFATIWQRQKGGDYKWVLVETGPSQAAPTESDMIAATVADCPVRRARGAAGKDEAAAPDHGKPHVADYRSGQSDDATLEWVTEQGEGDKHAFVLRLKQDGALHEVLRATTPGA